MPTVKNTKTKITKEPIKAIIPKQIPPKSSGNSSSIFIVVIIVIIVIVVSAVYFFDKNRTNNLFNDNNTENTNPDQYQVPLGVNVDSEKDPYEKWNSYKNASNTFEIKYPANWQLKTQNGIVKLIYPDSTSTEFAIDYKLTDKSFSQYLSDLDKVLLTAYEGKPSVTVTDEQKITVNGFQGVQRLQQVKAADMQQKIAYIYDNGKVLSFSMTSAQLTEDWHSAEDWYSAYGLILGSFKFISSTTALITTSTVATNTTTSNATSTATSTTEVAYKNSAYGFNIKYDSIFKPKSDANGINFSINASEYLKIVGSSSTMPSLIDYHPNGANVAGQITIGGKEAMKFTSTKNDLVYVQYILALSSKKWIKIEYQGNKDNALAFEKIISSIKFN